MPSVYLPDDGNMPGQFIHPDYSGYRAGRQRGDTAQETYHFRRMTYKIDRAAASLTNLPVDCGKVVCQAGTQDSKNNVVAPNFTANKN
jgi:hypothetical protein